MFVFFFPLLVLHSNYNMVGGKKKKTEPRTKIYQIERNLFERFFFFFFCYYIIFILFLFFGHLCCEQVKVSNFGERAVARQCVQARETQSQTERRWTEEDKVYSALYLKIWRRESGSFPLNIGRCWKMVVRRNFINMLLDLSSPASSLFL